MYTENYTEKEFFSYLSGKNKEIAKTAIEQFKTVQKTIKAKSIGGKLNSPIELKYRSPDKYEVYKGTIDTLWYNPFPDGSDWIDCDFSNYTVYKFTLSGKNGNLSTYKKTWRNTKPVSQDITLTEYLEDEDIKWLVDSTIDMFFEKSSKELLDKIAKEGIKCQYSLNTILNPKNKTKADVITQRGKYKFPKSIEKYPFVYDLFLREASKVFSEEAMSFFYSFDKAKEFCDSIVAGGFALKGLLCHGCWWLLWQKIDYSVVCEYLKNCKKSNEKANIEIKSEETMLRNLERLEIKNEMPREMDVDKVYIKLEKLLDGKYHLLRNTSEMSEEGMRQHNCVRTYIDSVDNHRCGIFNYDKDDKHYTIEVRYSKERGYECVQFYGFANSYDEKCRELNRIFSQELNTINEELEKKRLKREVA